MTLRKALGLAAIVAGVANAALFALLVEPLPLIPVECAIFTAGIGLFLVTL